VAEVLLKHGADPNVRDKFGMTALHVAAMRGNVTLVRRLVELGATTEALDGLVKTPADVAEDNEHKDVANFLKGVKYLPVAEVKCFFSCLLVFSCFSFITFCFLVSCSRLSCLSSAHVKIFVS